MINIFLFHVQVWLTGDNYMPVVKGLHDAVALDYHYEKQLVFWSENNLKVIRVAQLNSNNLTGEWYFFQSYSKLIYNFNNIFELIDIGNCLKTPLHYLLCF